LNRFHIIGSLGLAGLLGLATGSLVVFVAASAVMIGASVCTGDIRGKGGSQSGSRRHGK
jgi:hypothetical protein